MGVVVSVRSDNYRIKARKRTSMLEGATAPVPGMEGEVRLGITSFAILIVRQISHYQMFCRDAYFMRRELEVSTYVKT